MSGGISETILAFMDKGGDVLWLIAILVFVMWTLIFERLWFFSFVWRQERKAFIDRWEGRSERQSWNAKQIREKLSSQSRAVINDNMSVITTLVALCPLLGLLGTVTGMIEVFNVMAVTGGGDAKSMAGGVERSTIPTMAGMVAALSGLFANTYLQRIASREQVSLEDQLTADH
ncbi:MAG TPA: biopolymer transporter ExbB [Halieaceae bacterium]|jgi:biopolymer transport protein ExbB|nr:biopolymer transporter ExbB [Halieaceae bacterium]